VLAVLPGRAEVRHLYEVDYRAGFDHERIAATRADLLRSIARSLARRHPPGRALDLGCSSGYLLQELAALGWRAVGSDLSRDACALTRERAACPVVQADGAALPIRAGAVDAVALVNLVDHSTDPLAIVREAHRVLAADGLLFVRVVNAGFHRPLARALAAAPRLQRFLPLRPILHVFAFEARGLRRLVERAGFEVVEIRNSSLAAERGERGESQRRLMTLLRALVGLGAAAISALSARRWLLGPSLELHARRPGTPGRERP
jgi:SAM-dependent methyltransferase